MKSTRDLAGFPTIMEPAAASLNAIDPAASLLLAPMLTPGPTAA